MSEIERLRYILAIYVHAYEHDSGVPPFIESEAKMLLSKEDDQ